MNKIRTYKEDGYLYNMDIYFDALPNVQCIILNMHNNIEYKLLEIKDTDVRFKILNNYFKDINKEDDIFIIGEHNITFIDSNYIYYLLKCSNEKNMIDVLLKYFHVDTFEEPTKYAKIGNDSENTYIKYNNNKELVYKILLYKSEIVYHSLYYEYDPTDSIENNVNKLLIYNNEHIYYIVFI